VIVKFDNTVTLGNVLTAVGMAVGFAVYVNMQEVRVSRVEQAQISAKEADIRHEADIRALRDDIKGSLAEIKSDIKDLRSDFKKR
jgi:uncharacterized protein involved in high-affinity Fe2+ transport